MHLLMTKEAGMFRNMANKALHTGAGVGLAALNVADRISGRSSDPPKKPTERVAGHDNVSRLGNAARSAGAGAVARGMEAAEPHIQHVENKVHEAGRAAADKVHESGARAAEHVGEAAAHGVNSYHASRSGNDSHHHENRNSNSSNSAASAIGGALGSAHNNAEHAASGVNKAKKNAKRMALGTAALGTAAGIGTAALGAYGAHRLYKHFTEKKEDDSNKGSEGPKGPPVKGQAKSGKRSSVVESTKSAKKPTAK